MTPNEQIAALQLQVAFNKDLQALCDKHGVDLRLTATAVPRSAPPVEPPTAPVAQVADTSPVAPEAAPAA